MRREPTSFPQKKSLQKFSRFNSVAVILNQKVYNRGHSHSVVCKTVVFVLGQFTPTQRSIGRLLHERLELKKLVEQRPQKHRAAKEQYAELGKTKSKIQELSHKTRDCS